MTIPGHTVNRKSSHSTRSESVSKATLGAVRSRHDGTHAFIGNSSNPLTVFDPPVSPLANPSDPASAGKTREALLKLGVSPRDTVALAALWNENQPHRHLHSGSNSSLLKRLLASLVWHVGFFCDEVDDPKAWVARCANLAARRLALQLNKRR
jgi:hypothetical protein